MVPVLEAIAREVGAVGLAIHKLSGSDWELPTRCPPMSVKDLVAHMLRGARRINELIDSRVDSQPQKDAITWWDYDRSVMGPQVVQRSQADAASRTNEDLVRAWDVEWSQALRRARETIGEDPVGRGIAGLIRLSEFLRTRLIEITVHHMDLDDALGQEPHPDAVALEGVADVLRGILGTDLRPVGVPDLRFVLVGTGRAPLDERERSYLGPLADRFPLLA